MTYKLIHQSAWRQLPTAAVRSLRIEFVVDKVALGQVPSVYFGFICKLSFHELLRTHLPAGAGIIRPVVPGVPSGLRQTPKYE
jgi:hypothetical protein